MYKLHSTIARFEKKPGLLISQGFNRIRLCRFLCRVIAKKYTGEAQTKNDMAMDDSGISVGQKMNPV
jgi:hypothetical protein